RSSGGYWSSIHSSISGHQAEATFAGKAKGKRTPPKTRTAGRLLSRSRPHQRSTNWWHRHVARRRPLDRPSTFAVSCTETPAIGCDQSRAHEHYLEPGPRASLLLKLSTTQNYH